MYNFIPNFIQTSGFSSLWCEPSGWESIILVGTHLWACLLLLRSFMSLKTVQSNNGSHC